MEKASAPRSSATSDAIASPPPASAMAHRQLASPRSPAGDPTQRDEVGDPKGDDERNENPGPRRPDRTGQHGEAKGDDGAPDQREEK